jgi:hypothetical protein
MSPSNLKNLFIVVLGFVLLPLTASGQGGKQSQSGNTSTSQSSGNASLQGLSYSKDTWPKLLTLPDAAKVKKIAVICYGLVYTNSGVQPFVLEPRVSISGSEGNVVPCRVLDEKHPLMMDELLVIALDMREVDIKRLKILNINITNQQGNPINPTPVRPSFGASTTTTNLSAERIYYLTWPNRLPGDVIPTISVNAVYTPPAPGSTWEPYTFYPAGSVVTSELHYFTTASGGVSGSSNPSWVISTPARVVDNHVTWQHIGTTLPNGMQQPKPWSNNTAYEIGNIILAPTNTNYYIAIDASGDQKTGNNFPVFPVTSIASTRENPIDQLPKTDDQSVQWQATGKISPACNAKSDTSRPWLPTTVYKVNDIVCDPSDGREYRALVAGTSGAKIPDFARSPTGKYPIVWFDSGTIPPASVSNGQPPDQSLSLLNLQLPQSHSRSYYNISSGVVVSSIRNKSFGFATQPGSSTNSGMPVQTSSNLLVDPVLMFTVYIIPIDAERHWQPKDLYPGVSFGLSLSSPSSNFYFGGSSEILRNLQLVYGFNVAKVTKLAEGTVPTSSTSPATVQRYAKGGYIGLTFNLSGFIQGLFGGGGGGGGSKSSPTGQ